MTPIIAVFMSMISLLALVADRANLQEQTLSVQGEAIPLPSVDDGVSRNFLDVAKRTLPLKMTPARSMNLRRLPRAAPGAAPVRLTVVAVAPAPDEHLPDGVRDHGDDAVLLQSLIIRALRQRGVRDQASGEATEAITEAPSSSPLEDAETPRTAKKPRAKDNALGELKEDKMAHGRDREQLRRRWKIQDSRTRMASAHG